MGIKYSYKNLEDFLISHPLTVDAELNDGWGAYFPVKGIELDATILFADISAFSRRTFEMSPIETLVFVNTFFSWITAEAIIGKPCIVDKYIGDEIMLLFAKEFGSEDPFKDALITARFMGENDVHSYCPHIGIASGMVVAGYVGTPIKYSASLFGKPVTLASRCASIKPRDMCSSAIIFPSNLWKYESLDGIFKPTLHKGLNGEKIETQHSWQLLESREVEIKNMKNLLIREIINPTMWFSQTSAEERAKKSVKSLLKDNGFSKNRKINNK
jgi:hypothetical protein